MPLTAEQVRDFHEKFGEQLRNESYWQDSATATIEAMRTRYGKGLDLVRRLAAQLQFDIDDDDDAVRCPHCDERLL